MISKELDQEWINLIEEAINSGVTIKEIQDFINMNRKK
ncbi:anti-repressor SinI family protein [Jeotgalibacillus soli]|uniref:Sin domain-containing protein n=1 Tax=Jeotgalibacillus soli TaxID=889306 RepID=A0A0C2R3Z5_9BACL|nr:anti-repressor SinI family protein [Jeotgalibacillus soli]KIL44975.1 hypothetical protein KP78_25190 [Jeotgalibacillus soli]